MKDAIPPLKSDCPICGSERTRYHDVYSDGDNIVERPLNRQECCSSSCGLPYPFWNGVRDILNALAEDEQIVFEHGRWIWTTNGHPVFFEKVIP
jgi:hypothetical protein